MVRKVRTYADLITEENTSIPSGVVIRRRKNGKKRKKNKR